MKRFIVVVLLCLACGSGGGGTGGGSGGSGGTSGGGTGSTAGGSTAGGSTAGGTGSTAGGSTAGGSTAGGSTAGGSSVPFPMTNPITSTVITSAGLVTSDIALDSAGRPHIVFAETLPDDGGTYLATLPTDGGSAWELTRLPIPRATPKIAIDGTNTIHLFYDTPMGPGYASRVNGVWSSELVQSGISASGIDFALTPTGQPSAAYCVKNLARLDGGPGVADVGAVVAQRGTGGGWTQLVADRSESIGMTANAGFCNGIAMALDSAGEPHLVYRGRDGGINDTVRYAAKSGSTWTLVDVVSATHNVGSIGLVGPSYAPHVVSANGATGSTYTPDGGVTGVWRTIGFIGGEPSMKRDALGNVWCASTGSGNTMQLGRISSGSVLQTYNADTGTRFPAIAVDAQNQPHVVYRKGTNPNYTLIYAHW